jgi:hypothetical protein
MVDAMEKSAPSEAMRREEFPQIFEIRDLLPRDLPEGVRFPALDGTIVEYPQKRRLLRDIENDLRGLDAAAWAALKAKVPPLLRKHRTRVWEPLYDTLNEAKAYNYLTRVGYTDVRLSPIFDSVTFRCIVRSPPHTGVLR